MQDVTHRVSIYSSKWDFIQHNSCKKTYIRNEQLHALKLGIIHGIGVHIEALENEPKSLMCRSTRSQSWCSGDWANHWVWVMQHPGRCYAALNGCFLWHLQRLFKIKLLDEDGTFVWYRLALALSTIPENSTNLDPVSKFGQVWTAPAAIAMHVFSLGNIVGCVHVIPAIPTTNKTGDRRNEWWIVNSHRDLETWNDVYN